MATTDTPPVDDVPFVDDQIAPRERREPVDPVKARRAKRSMLLRPLMWRMHFLGGILAGPVILSLAITGILYAWAPQIDGLRYGSIMEPTSKTVDVSMAQQVLAAQRAHPTWKLVSVTPGYAPSGAPDLNTAVNMDPTGGRGDGPYDNRNVYVDQHTGEVTGDVEVGEQSDGLFRNLHSNWLLGDSPRPLTELAAAWFLVSLMTGVYLWWPGLRKRGAAAFAFRRNLRGRRWSKDWHTFIGVAILAPMIFVSITGLTWTKFTGAHYDTVKEQVFHPAPSLLAADTTMRAPAPGSDAVTNVDKVLDRAREAKLPNPVTITVPTDDATAWQAASQRQRFPMNRDAIAVNGETGAVTSRYDWSKEHWLTKLTTAGVSFHQAQLFGVPLQIFMTLLAIGVIALVLSGYRMWWERRPQGGMGAPPPIRSWLRNAPVTLLAVILVLGWLLPTLALSLVVWLVLERAFLWARVARGGPGARAAAARMAKQGAPLRPGVEFAKAAVVGVLGLFMVVAPDIGTFEPGSGGASTANLIAWAWSWPLGIAFLVAGAVGLYAMFGAGGRPVRGGTGSASGDGPARGVAGPTSGSGPAPGATQAPAGEGAAR